MKVNTNTIAQEAFKVKESERNIIQKTCIALSEPQKHLGAKQEELRALGWEHASYIYDADSKKESAELWDKLLQKSPIAILVMTSRGEVTQSFVPDFPTFDIWCRTNDIKRMEQLTNTDGKIWRTNFII